MKNKNFIIYSTVVIIFILTLLIMKYISDTRNNYQLISEKVLFQQASTLFNNLVTIRKWSSDHGGIYVKSHNGIEPNPYLVDNHTYTKDNELLIKINPAWMTRQLSELSNAKENFLFKITSLEPINPKNLPDDFELRALKYLKTNKDKQFYTSLENTKYNLLGSLKVEPSCLHCHNTQNYKVGDIIGGLRVSVPVDNYNEYVEIIDSKTDLLHFITLFTSIIFIIIITFAIDSIFTREFNFRRLNQTLENKVNQRTKELSKANKKLLEISNIDYLTNIFNRRYFFENGIKFFYSAKKEKNNLSIICIDIDHFKKTNDTYGHNIGDEILKLVANTMNRYIRKSDILARTGGEEFSILLNNTDENNAFTLAEKLRLEVEKLSYKDNNIDVKVTISLGISQLREDDEELDSIIIRADKALYYAKEANRNQSIIYS